jgi:hypothetical protein
MIVLHLSDMFLDFSAFWTLQVAGVEHHSGFEMHNDLIKKHRLLVSITFHQSKADPFDGLGRDVVKAVEINCSGVQILWLSYKNDLVKG